MTADDDIQRLEDGQRQSFPTNGCMSRLDGLVNAMRHSRFLAPLLNLIRADYILEGRDSNDDGLQQNDSNKTVMRKLPRKAE